jgi:uncharacterized protein (TIGR03118 family)
MSKPLIARSTAVVLLLLVAPASAQYHQTNIASDGSVSAPIINPNLKDPWGLSFTTGSPFWISDQASNFQNASTGTSAPVTTLLMVPAGGAAPSTPGLIVNVPNQGGAAADPTANGPTGQVTPGAPGITTIATDFQVVGPNNGPSHQASFIFANMDGSISAWAGGNSGTPTANTTATLMPTTVVAGASFTGLAIANNPLAAVGGASGVQLYAADQNSGNIDVFNSAWQKIGTFTDPTGLPAGFTAFNVQNINGVLYVTFANQSSPNGFGGGIVDEFKTDGTFIKRLITTSAGDTNPAHLALPWGVALAPTGFGQFGGDLLVGNNGGAGWINAFDPNTGALVGSITLDNGHFFHEGNLWALSFGNGANAGNANTLYFTAGLDAAGDEGLFGSISVVPEPTSMLLVGIGGTIVAVVHLRRRKGRLVAAGQAG